MERVNVTYTRNIYFTVKTTSKYFQSRLLPLALTWLQVVDANKVSFRIQHTDMYVASYSYIIFVVKAIVSKA